MEGERAGPGAVGEGQHMPHGAVIMRVLARARRAAVLRERDARSARARGRWGSADLELALLPEAEGDQVAGPGEELVLPLELARARHVRVGQDAGEEGVGQLGAAELEEAEGEAVAERGELQEDPRLRRPATQALRGLGGVGEYDVVHAAEAGLVLLRAEVSRKLLAGGGELVVCAADGVQADPTGAPRDVRQLEVVVLCLRLVVLALASWGSVGFVFRSFADAQLSWK